MPGVQEVRVRHLGRQDYVPTWEAMDQFTTRRDESTPDEIWLVEHPPVFTQGRNGKPEHLLAPGDIPVIQVDRGGQVTYHGPGQVVVYVLLDLNRLGLGIRQLVRTLEQAVIETLAEWDIAAEARIDAPGVYVDDAKIASVGLRVRRGRTYHGLSLNVGMDLSPFQRINPCGYQGLRVTQVRDLGGPSAPEYVSERLLSHLSRLLGYTILSITEQP